MAGARHGSIFAQLALLIALALLVAHAVSFFVILDGRQRLMMSDTSSIAIQRFVEALKDLQSARTQDDIDTAVREHATPGFRLRAQQTAIAVPDHVEREPRLDSRLRRALKTADVGVANFSVGIRELDQPPRPFVPRPGAAPPGAAPPFDPAMAAPSGRPPALAREIVFSAELDNGVYVGAVGFWRQPHPGEVARFASIPVIVYVTLLLATLWLARRIMRPLRTMTQTARDVGRPGPPPHIPPHGPAEVRALIASFNAMATRVSSVLRQKDELIGAIGHDLRTPLASLRVRIESIADDSIRAPIVEAVDEITRLVEDTLDIARLGHTTETPRLVDLAALVDAVADEYRARKAPVQLTDSGERVITLCRVGLTRRLLRNLIDNALKYGSRAQLTLTRDGQTATLLVYDEGPGVAPEALERISEPFVRLEASRNRSTGGAGLGLAIATRIAEVDGVSLKFLNGEPRGLVVSVSWPVAKTHNTTRKAH